MTATNHALTGAAIGLLIGEPLVAIPAAIVSHFICDALPHYDSADPGDHYIASRGFGKYVTVEVILCFLIVLVLAITQPQHWVLACLCAFFAAAPDFWWIKRFQVVRQGRRWHPGNWFSKFALNIQWFAKPIGGVFEAVWAIAVIVIIVPFLR